MSEDPGTSRPRSRSLGALLIECLGRWRRRAGGAQAEAARRRLDAALDASLHDIDFAEVTLEDRIAFVECVVDDRVRRAVARGRFDLVPHLRAVGARKAGELETRRSGGGDAPGGGARPLTVRRGRT